MSGVVEILGDEPLHAEVSARQDDTVVIFSFFNSGGTCARALFCTSCKTMIWSEIFTDGQGSTRTKIAQAHERTHEMQDPGWGR